MHEGVYLVLLDCNQCGGTRNKYAHARDFTTRGVDNRLAVGATAKARDQRMCVKVSIQFQNQSLL